MTTTKTRRTFASVCHGIAERFELDPEQVAAIAAEADLPKRVSSETRLVELVEAWIARRAAEADDAPKTDGPKPRAEKKPGLTLSQRRALLRLLDALDGVAPASAFKALPYEHLVECGYAVNTDGVYTLTDAGTARATSINPGYRVWASGETVAGDPNRPAAGTARGVFDLGDEVEAEGDAPEGDDAE
jgi:hypothetical protein